MNEGLITAAVNAARKAENRSVYHNPPLQRAIGLLSIADRITLPDTPQEVIDASTTSIRNFIGGLDQINLSDIPRNADTLKAIQQKVEQLRRASLEPAAQAIAEAYPTHSAQVQALGAVVLGTQVAHEIKLRREFCQSDQPPFTPDDFPKIFRASRFALQEPRA